uniref:Uncharacterized protein n=1 Tax=Cacopsylla melanoneura TaxID=428564 RepID=A0A8D8QVL1_9HEMI
MHIGRRMIPLDRPECHRCPKMSLFLRMSFSILTRSFVAICSLHQLKPLMLAVLFPTMQRYILHFVCYPSFADYPDSQSQLFLSSQNYLWFRVHRAHHFEQERLNSHKCVILVWAD